MIKQVRATGRFLGRYLDQEDREFLARAIVLVLGVGFAVLFGAALLGLAIRVFEVAAG